MWWLTAGIFSYSRPRYENHDNYGPGVRVQSAGWQYPVQPSSRSTQQYLGRKVLPIIVIILAFLSCPSHQQGYSFIYPHHLQADRDINYAFSFCAACSVFLASTSFHCGGDGGEYGNETRFWFKWDVCW